MRLSMLNVESVARQIVGLARSILLSDDRLVKLLKLRDPDVSLPESVGDPVVLTFRVGARTPEALTISVFSASEIKAELSQRLSRLLGLPVHSSLSSVSDVGRFLSGVVDIISSKV